MRPSRLLTDTMRQTKPEGPDPAAGRPLSAQALALPADLPIESLMSSILVIDDDPAAGKLLELALGREGHQVDVARDVTSGQRAARSGQHDLMILDVFMPDGSGLDLLRYLRGELGYTIPVLVLTGHRQEDFLARAQEAGATGYVTKPFNLRDLLAEVTRLTG
jgi:two-component system, OmpR family, phosphate regulon response regulator PhoB